MGMFDTIHFTCPKCGQKTENQTKAGPCILKDYDLDLPISLEEAYEVNGITVECLNCYTKCNIGSSDLPGYFIRMQIEEVEEH